MGESLQQEQESPWALTLTERVPEAFEIPPSDWPEKYFSGQSAKSGGGGQGGGRPGEKGAGVYGRREKRGREAGFPRWREAGEKGKNYATLRNISQSKKMQRGGSQKIQGGNRD